MIGIPKNAKRVFKGVIFDVYQWKQKMFDGSFATFEKLKRPYTAAVIPVTKDKKILLAFDEQPDRGGVYTTFGGRIEPGEEALLAAQRELLEESGYASNDWELFMTDTPSGKIDWNIYYYIARGCEKKSEPKPESGEKIKVEVLDFDGFIDIVTSEGYYDVGFANAIFRMIKEGTLEKFKQRLLK